MPIELASINEEVDDDAFEEEGDGTQYNMRELMDQVYKLRDCIIQVPSDQVAALKSGLITRKAKDNAKLKRADISVANEVLSFLVYQAKKDGQEIPGVSDVRVKLGPKKSVTVIDIRVPDDDF